MNSSDYRRLAREALSGKWWLSIGVCFIASIFLGDFIRIEFEYEDLKNYYQYNDLVTLLRPLLTGAISLNFLHLILGGVVKLGRCTYFLNLHDRKEATFKDLFSRFSLFGTAFCMELLISLFTTLWSLLFLIPGIVAAYSYEMAPYILAEHPEYTAREAIAASKKLMYGHKMESFLLDLSFIGWILLSMLTLGLGGLALQPYTIAAKTAFYRNLCPVQSTVDAE